MSVPPEIALSVTLSKIDEALAKMLEGERYASDFRGKMRSLISEVQALRREIEQHWRQAIRGLDGAPPERGPPSIHQ